jgi:acetyl esterase/lipase
MRLTFFLLLFMLVKWSGAQHYLMHPDIPVDTTYNVLNEFRKHRKNIPNLQIAGIGDTSQIEMVPDVVYATLQGRELHLDIIKPAGQQSGERLPVVVMVHGGGWRSGDKEMEWPMAFALARRGYACVVVEYRTSMEALYPAAIIDVRTAIRWTRAHARKYNFDPNRIAIQGNSAGGQMASLIGSINGKHARFDGRLYRRQSNVVQAVVNLDGLLAFIHPESGEGRDQPGKPSAATLWFGSTTEDNPDVRHEASALTHIHRESAPTLFINSSIPRFGAGRDDYIATLQTYGIHYEMHGFPDDIHTFWLFEPYFNSTIERIDDFLKLIFVNS